MKNIIVYMVCAIATSLAMANAQTITGKVINRNQEPVEYATVVLQATDSLYVNSTYTDSVGHFVFSTDMSVYRLVVQHLLYETYEKSYSGEYAITVELTEKENALGEVVVKGERPVVKLVDGRITYNMPALLSGTTVSNAYESILRLPGVREQNGSLTLAGTSSVTVIINGQVTSMPHENLMAALKMYPAEMIQSAEIMYSAPPQYHVRGAAINLVLKGDNYIIFNKATGKKLYIIYNSSKSISVGVLSDNPATQCQWLKSGDWYNIFIIKLKSDKVTSAM